MMRAGPSPVFLKVAPDLDEAGIEAITRAALDNRMSGLIVSNHHARPARYAEKAATRARRAGFPARR